MFKKIRAHFWWWLVDFAAGRLDLEDPNAEAVELSELTAPSYWEVIYGNTDSTAGDVRITYTKP